MYRISIQICSRKKGASEVRGWKEQVIYQIGQICQIHTLTYSVHLDSVVLHWELSWDNVSGDFLIGKIGCALGLAPDSVLGLIKVKHLNPKQKSDGRSDVMEIRADIRSDQVKALQDEISAFVLRKETVGAASEGEGSQSRVAH